jgi:hypothetical protein
MEINKGRIILSDEDVKELFSLFSSPTKYEKEQIYREDSADYFGNIELSEEYELCQQKRDFALDCWRAVLFFLHAKGYVLSKDSKVLDLAFSEEEFI